MKRRWLWLLAAAAVLAGAIVPLALGGRDALAATREISAAAVLGLAGLALASALARAIKLRLLAMRLGQHVGVARALITSLASDAAFQATPAGAGGYPATVFLLRRGGVPMSAGLAMCAADQALDTLFFVLALPLACAFDLGDAVPAIWHEFAWVPAAAVALAALAIVGAWRSHRRWWPPLRRQCLRVAWLRQRRTRLRKFRNHLIADLARLCTGSPFVTLALACAVAAQWLARYGALWLALAALGAPLHFGLVFVAQSVALHVAQWTGVPGGVGGGDVALAGALSPWAPLAVLGPALLLWRLTTFHAVLLIGTIAFACDRRRVDDAVVTPASRPVRVGLPP
ncbi:MAG TPA: flippase-like domain-containing protein [Rhodanobacteraceae bacterium]|nr:flippase-like domain-containing protein [Rhodanobacteraceae bacterium]